MCRRGSGRRCTGCRTAAKEEVTRPVLRNAEIACMNEMTAGRKPSTAKGLENRVEKAMPVDPANAGHVLQTDDLGIELAAKACHMTVKAVIRVLRVTAPGRTEALTRWPCQQSSDRRGAWHIPPERASR